jgi:hypothetical protein
MRIRESWSVVASMQQGTRNRTGGGRFWKQSPEATDGVGLWGNFPPLFGVGFVEFYRSMCSQGESWPLVYIPSFISSFIIIKIYKKKKCSSSQYMYILYIRKIKQNKYETKCFIFHGTVRLEWEHMTTCGIMFSHFYVHVNTGRPFF